VLPIALGITKIKMSKILEKYQRLIAEVDGQFIRSDQSPLEPLNKKRVVNTTILTQKLVEAKDFYFFQEDVLSTKRAIPHVVFFDYYITVKMGKTSFEKYPNTFHNSAKI